MADVMYEINTAHADGKLNVLRNPSFEENPPDCAGWNVSHVNDKMVKVDREGAHDGLCYLAASDRDNRPRGGRGPLGQGHPSVSVSLGVGYDGRYRTFFSIYARSQGDVEGGRRLQLKVWNLGNIGMPEEDWFVIKATEKMEVTRHWKEYSIDAEGSRYWRFEAFWFDESTHDICFDSAFLRVWKL